MDFIKMYTLYINSIEIVVIIKTIIYICRRDKKIQRKTVLKAPENATRLNHQFRLCCLSNANCYFPSFLLLLLIQALEDLSFSVIVTRR